MVCQVDNEQVTRDEKVQGQRGKKKVAPFSLHSKQRKYMQLCLFPFPFTLHFQFLAISTISTPLLKTQTNHPNFQIPFLSFC